MAELFVVGLILLYFGARIWLYARFDSVVENLDYAGYVEDIKSTPALPETVFEAFEKVHNFDERRTTNQLLSSLPVEIFLNSRNMSSCSCMIIGRRQVQGPYNTMTLALHLDKDAGSRKCLEFYLNNCDFLFNQIGIRNASEFYFGKSLEDLSEREMLKLCLMSKNPALYNHITHPERVERWMNSSDR